MSSGMSQLEGFQSDLVVRWADKRTWVTESPLIYDAARVVRRFQVPKGFETDFASVPRVFRGMVARQTATARAATLHDYLVRKGDTLQLDRYTADALFREALESEGIGGLTAWLMHRLGVNVGSFFAKNPFFGDLLMLGLNRIARRFLPLLCLSLVAGLLAAASGGCSVSVDKSLTQHNYGPDGELVQPEGAEVAATQPDDDGTMAAEHTGYGQSNTINYDQQSETETSVEQAMRAAVEAMVSATGQGTAESSQGDGGAAVSPGDRRDE